ncbi:N-acetylmuramoyl-L-alanine amidase, partial [Paenibacillus sp. UNC496MF]
QTPGDGGQTPVNGGQTPDNGDQTPSDGTTTPPAGDVKTKNVNPGGANSGTDGGSGGNGTDVPLLTTH